MKPNEQRIKVLLADDDNQMTRRLSDFLIDKGFDVRSVNQGKEARAQILEWKPRYVLADLMLPDGNALQLIEFIKGEKTLRHQFIHTIVMSGHNTPSNVKLAFQHGAKDYIVKPFKFDDLLKRLIFHTRNYRGLADLNKESNKFDESGMMLHLTDLFLRQALGGGHLDDILFNLTRMLTMKVDGVRCSIVHCLDQHVGLVVTSNDDRSASGIQLDLYKYPEILHVLNTGNLIAIENIDESAELRHIKDAMTTVQFNSMVVCPLTRRGETFGVISLRMPPEKTKITDNEIRFVEIASHVISLVLSNEIHKEKDNFWIHPATAAVLNFPKK
jgi:DNA-binding response OmpR family regulator